MSESHSKREDRSIDRSVGRKPIISLTLTYIFLSRGDIAYPGSEENERIGSRQVFRKGTKVQTLENI